MNKFKKIFVILLIMLGASSVKADCSLLINLNHTEVSNITTKEILEAKTKNHRKIAFIKFRFYLAYHGMYNSTQVRVIIYHLKEDNFDYISSHLKIANYVSTLTQEDFDLFGSNKVDQELLTELHNLIHRKTKQGNE